MNEPHPIAESVRDAEPYHRGWKVGDTAVYVGHLPGRIAPCVYVQKGSVIDTLAHFRGHRANEKAYRLIALLDQIAKALYVGEEAT
jgi:hypothetical protein